MSLCTVNLHMEIVSSLPSHFAHRAVWQETLQETLCQRPKPHSAVCPTERKKPKGISENHKVCKNGATRPTTPEDASKHHVLPLFDKINAELNGDCHRETGLSSDQSCNWPQGFFLQMRHLTLDNFV